MQDADTKITLTEALHLPAEQQEAVKMVDALMVSLEEVVMENREDRMLGEVIFNLQKLHDLFPPFAKAMKLTGRLYEKDSNNRCPAVTLYDDGDPEGLVVFVSAGSLEESRELACLKRQGHWPQLIQAARAFALSVEA